jgi:spermidine synthase
VKKSLAKVEIYTAVDLLGTYAGQATDLQGWAQGAQINTDRNLRLQYLAGWGFNSFLGSELLADIHRYYRFPERLFVGSEARLQILRFQLEGEPKQSR